MRLMWAVLVQPDSIGIEDEDAVIIERDFFGLPAGFVAVAYSLLSSSLSLSIHCSPSPSFPREQCALTLFYLLTFFLLFGILNPGMAHLPARKSTAFRKVCGYCSLLVPSKMRPSENTDTGMGYQRHRNSPPPSLPCSKYSQRARISRASAA